MPEAGRRKSLRVGRFNSSSTEAKQPTGDEEKAEYKSTKMQRELRNLDDEWNPVMRDTMSRATVIEPDETGEDIAKEVHFVFNVELHNDDDMPEDYKSAMQGDERDKWEPSMASEIMNFVKRKSWKPVNKSKVIASGKTIMKTKWVFKKKDAQDGTTRFKSRLVSKVFNRNLGLITQNHFHLWPTTHQSGQQFVLLYFTKTGQLK